MLGFAARRTDSIDFHTPILRCRLRRRRFVKYFFPVQHFESSKEKTRLQHYPKPFPNPEKPAIKKKKKKEKNQGARIVDK